METVSLEYFVNGNKVTRKEYIDSFIDEAKHEHRTVKLANEIVGQDESTALNHGYCAFYFDTGGVFEIKRSIN